jgi:hypothetical protein
MQHSTNKLCTKFFRVGSFSRLSSPLAAHQIIDQNQLFEDPETTLNMHECSSLGNVLVHTSSISTRDCQFSNGPIRRKMKLS